MTLIDIMRNAIGEARKAVLENLDRAAMQTGDTNPFGDRTLLLDINSEKEMIRVLQDSNVTFAILSEEHGVFEPSKKPEYLAIIDPIDGSANLERGVPLCSVGISIVPFADKMTTDDIEVSIIDSYFTEETYVAIKGKGVTRNGKRVTPSGVQNPDAAIISYDTKRKWDHGFDESSLRTLIGVHDIRRTGSNLLDLCWTASGGLDCMVDMRDVLPIVHVSGTHMVKEAGGTVLDKSGNVMILPLDFQQRMSFVAAGTPELAKNVLELFRGP